VVGARLTDAELSVLDAAAAKLCVTRAKAHKAALGRGLRAILGETRVEHLLNAWDRDHPMTVNSEDG